MIAKAFEMEQQIFMSSTQSNQKCMITSELAPEGVSAPKQIMFHMMPRIQIYFSLTSDNLLGV